MKKIQPIKRSPQLVPLSKDHHEGLLLAWKIRQGLKNGTGPKVISEYVHWFWTNHLQEHFRKEEKVLAPLLPADNELVKQMFEEHQEIEGLVRINENIPDPELLARFAQVLDDHIRFEERQLFPYAETLLSQDQLNSVFGQLHTEPAQCSPWEKEFWNKK